MSPHRFPPNLSRQFAALKFIWIRLVASDPMIGGQACRVAAILLDYFRIIDATAWPSQDRLARDAGVSRRTLGAALRRLEAAGYLTIARAGRNQVNRYRLSLPTELSTGSVGEVRDGKSRVRQTTQTFPRILGQNPSPYNPPLARPPITGEAREAIRDGMVELIADLRGAKAPKAKGGEHV